MTSEKVSRLTFTEEPNWVYLFLSWSFVTFIGFFISNELNLYSSIVRNIIEFTGNESDRFFLITSHTLSGLQTGLIIGFLQSLILNFYVIDSFYWFFSTLAGYLFLDLIQYSYLWLPWLGCCKNAPSIFPYSVDHMQHPRLFLLLGQWNNLCETSLFVISLVWLGIAQWVAIRRWVNHAYLWIIFVVLSMLIIEIFIHPLLFCSGIVFFSFISGFMIILLFRSTWLEERNKYKSSS
jgi:hypothetical protein